MYLNYSNSKKIANAGSRATAMAVAQSKLEKHKKKFVSIMNNAIKIIKEQGFRFPLNEIGE